MPVSQNEYLWSGATPILLISPARFFVYKGPKIDYFLSTPLDYRLLFVLVSGGAWVGVWGSIGELGAHYMCEVRFGSVLRSQLEAKKGPLLPKMKNCFACM